MLAKKVSKVCLEKRAYRENAPKIYEQQEN
jgi:hypothetical protein